MKHRLRAISVSLWHILYMCTFVHIYLHTCIRIYVYTHVCTEIAIEEVYKPNQTKPNQIKSNQTKPNQTKRIKPNQTKRIVNYVVKKRIVK